MNAVVSLCHFCEIHGPSVLMSTQPCRSHRITKVEDSILRNTFYGSPECLKINSPEPASCDACHSLQRNIYISSDDDTLTSYVSAQLPWQMETEALVKQACTRSLSCEVSSGKEGIFMFSDVGSGIANGSSVLSNTFLIKDSLARGFHRWFSIIVLTRDRILLLNTWPFLEKTITGFISHLQSGANVVYDAELAVTSQRALRLVTAQCPTKTSRPLSDLTGIPQVFPQLHLWFVWLLQNASNHLREYMLNIDHVFPVEFEQESEDGFTFITAKPDPPESSDHSISDIEFSPLTRINTTGPSVSSLNTLRSLLGAGDFVSLLYCLIVGRQVVVRGQPPSLVASILFSLKSLLPRKCQRLVLYSSQYLSSSQCNLLGLDPRAAVPQPCPQVARLEILPPDCLENCDNLRANQFSYHLKWNGQLPEKWPSLLVKLERAMEPQRLSDSTIALQISVLLQETLNAARLLRQLETVNRKNQSDDREKSRLLQSLGVSSSDVDVLSFFSS